MMADLAYRRTDLPPQLTSLGADFATLAKASYNALVLARSEHPIGDTFDSLLRKLRRDQDGLQAALQALQGAGSPSPAGSEAEDKLQDALDRVGQQIKAVSDAAEEYNTGG